MMRFTILLLVIACGLPLCAQVVVDGDHARKGGPSLSDSKRLIGRSPHQLLSQMFEAMEQHWFLPGYDQAASLNFRANLNADLPVSSLGQGLASSETLDFDLEVEGVATPDGKHRLKVDGGLGRVEMVNDLRRRLMASPSFKAFSDTPIRERSADANLTNYRSYILRHVNELKESMLNSGHYRSVYIGTSSWQGFNVNVVRLYKPKLKTRSKGKRPIPLSKMWTFWQEGGYEIWLDEKNHLPRVVFYTNTEDNVYANFQIEYNAALLPSSISFNNNSLKAEGRGDLTLTYDRDNLLSGISLSFAGERSISLRFDAALSFAAAPPSDAFRLIPPFGFKKINRDHLKLMVLTELSGGLLKLKKHGVNFKNFKF